MIESPRLVDLLQRILIALPGRTTVNTLDLTWFGASPLLEAGAVDVLATGSFAPEDVFKFV